MKKKIYTKAEIQSVKLDKEISLILQSGPLKQPVGEPSNWN